MKKIRKILKRMLLSFVGIIVVLVVLYLVFVSWYPSFGGEVSKQRKAQYEASTQFEDGTFKNVLPVPKDPSFSEILTMSRKFFFEKVENSRPASDLLPERLDSLELANYNGVTRLIWFGHSSFLIQMEGKNILIDPMFSEVPAPHPWLGNKRFNENPPIEITSLPKIDLVLISHDHYDHLDYQSIKQLKDKVDQFYVPLGVGVHLQTWGVDSDRIAELDWWQDLRFRGIEFICTPAQHFSGRKFSNRQSTLWSSWIIRSTKHTIFFSGDSGYADHFKEIGEKYGPFDFAMLECGQYNTMWPDVHMFPEETAQAGVDIGAKVIMPIHWAGFKLALHSWTDPIDRVSAKAKELDIPLVTPRIGQAVVLDTLAKPREQWWRN